MLLESSSHQIIVPLHAVLEVGKVVPKTWGSLQSSGRTVFNGNCKVSLFFFTFTLYLDLHPHAPSLPGHAAAKGGDPPVSGDPTPPGKKSHCN